MFPASHAKFLLEKRFSGHKALCVQEALTSCTSSINSVKLTGIILSRSELRSTRSSKGDFCRAGAGWVWSSDQFNQGDRDWPVEK